MEDLTDALEKAALGTARDILPSPQGKERTTFNGFGHALLGMIAPGADPLRNVSVIPRGKTLGTTP